MAAHGAVTFMGVDCSSIHCGRAPLAAPIPSTEYRPLPGGDAAIYQTLDAMAGAVRGEIPPDFSGYQDQFNMRVAAHICGGVGGAFRAQIAALFDYVAHSIQYAPHPFNFQVLQDCRRSLEIGAGDCVSKSVCLATLLACLGTRPRFVAQCDGNEFMHVYVEAPNSNGQGGWLALDPVADDKPMGWSQPLPDGGFETTWEIFT